MKFIYWSFVFLLGSLLLPFSAIAQVKVVVIPMGGDGPRQVVNVEKSGGDFSSPQAAILSISDESANNRYLIHIGPGEFTLSSTLIMRPYIDIVGTGPGKTILSGAISANDSNDAAIIKGADNALLNGMSIQNSGGSGLFSIGVRTNFASPALSDLSVTVSGSDRNHAISIVDASPTLSGVTIDVTGGSESIGIYSIRSEASLSKLDINIGDSDFSVGNYCSSSCKNVLNDVNITVLTAVTLSSAYGSLSNLSSTVMLSNATILATGPTAYGISNSNSSSTIVTRSNITAIIPFGFLSPRAITNTSATTYSIVRDSNLTGDIRAGSGTGNKGTYLFDSIVSGSFTGNTTCYAVSTSGGSLLGENCH